MRRVGRTLQGQCLFCNGVAGPDIHGLEIDTSFQQFLKTGGVGRRSLNLIVVRRFRHLVIVAVIEILSTANAIGFEILKGCPPIGWDFKKHLIERGIRHR